MTIPPPEPGSATTPVYQWHIPTAGDAPNVPFDATQTALAIEGTVKAHHDEVGKLGLTGKMVQHGSAVFSVTGGVSPQITYPTPFTAKVYPVVCMGDSNGPAMTVKVTDASSTSTYFRVALYTAAGGPVEGGPYRLNWFAVGPVAAGA